MNPAPLSILREPITPQRVEIASMPLSERVGFPLFLIVFFVLVGLS